MAVSEPVLAALITAGVLSVGTVQGLLAGRRITAQRYFAGPGDLGFVRSWFSITVSLVGSFMVFSLVQMAFEGGLTPVVLGLAYPLSLAILIPAVRRNAAFRGGASGELSGLDAVLDHRFGRMTVVFFWVAQLVAFFGILAGQFLAIATYIRFFHGVDQMAIALLLAVLAPVAYTTVAGFYGVVRNDLIQGVFVVAFLALFIVPVLLRDGIHLPLEGIGVVSLWGSYGGTFALGGALLLVPTLAVRADIWQRIQITRPSRRRPVVIATFLTVFAFYALVPLAGWAARASIGNAEVPPEVFPFILQHYSGSGVVRAFLMASILSALVSSIDSYLSVCSNGLVRLVARRQWAELSAQASGGRELLAAGRVATVFVALLSGMLAFAFPDLVDLLVASFSVIGVCMPVTLVAIFSTKRFTDAAGAVPIALGLAAWLLAVPLLGKVAFVPGVLVSITATMVGRRWVRP